MKPDPLQYPDPVTTSDEHGTVTTLKVGHNGSLWAEQIGPGDDKPRRVVLTQDDLIAALNLRQEWLRAREANLAMGHEQRRP